MVCVFVDVESSRFRASDSPKSDWLCVSEVLLAVCAAARLHGYKACSLPMYTKAMKDLLRMLARASVAQTLRGTRCGGGACMQSSKKCLAASVSNGMVSRTGSTSGRRGKPTVEEFEDSGLQVGSKILRSNGSETAELAKSRSWYVEISVQLHV
jgi:hypothetical protein